jgi:tRNA-Thr(GGU) m(6)t(6)A37 methyltransferase TsaA
MKKNKITYRIIGIVHSPHKSSEGIPIQPIGARGIKAEIEIFEEYREGLKDLDGFSHIIVLYHFHKSKDFNLTVKPFLDEEIRGVFATRAPKRPNSIGLSVLKLIKIDKNILHVENVDILDGTPVLDIKPYASHFDYVENERIGWLEKNINKSSDKKADNRFK